MRLQYIIKCNICGSINSFTNNIKTITYNDKEFYIKKCNRCGYVRQTPIHDFEEYYNLGYHTQQDYKTHSINRARYIFNFINLPMILKIRNNDTFDILDIGSGKGLVSLFLKEKFSNISKIPVTVEGITLHKEDKLYIDTKYLNVDDITHLKKINKKYDLIIMSHSLEHIANVDTLIEYIHDNLLKFEGLLYIEVPSLYTTGVRGNGTFIPHHISYFTKTSLSNLLYKYRHFNILKMHESKYWGNIKCLVKKSHSVDRGIYEISHEKLVYIRHQFYKILNLVNYIRIKYFKKKPKENE